MVAVKQLDHLNMTVNNLDESIAWYGKLFGFEQVEGGERQGRPWGIIRSGDVVLCLNEQPQRAFEALFPEHDRHGICHFGLQIDDPNRFRQLVEEENLELFFGGETDYPYSTSWYIADPTGHSIEVVAWDNGEIRFPA